MEGEAVESMAMLLAVGGILGTLHTLIVREQPYILSIVV